MSSPDPKRPRIAERRQNDASGGEHWGKPSDAIFGGRSVAPLHSLSQGEIMPTPKAPRSPAPRAPRVSGSLGLRTKRGRESTALQISPLSPGSPRGHVARVSECMARVQSIIRQGATLEERYKDPDLYLAEVDELQKDLRVAVARAWDAHENEARRDNARERRRLCSTSSVLRRSSAGTEIASLAEASAPEPAPEPAAESTLRARIATHVDALLKEVDLAKMNMKSVREKVASDLSIEIEDKDWFREHVTKRVQDEDFLDDSYFSPWPGGPRSVHLDIFDIFD